jgi:hypothetical protein
MGSVAPTNEPEGTAMNPHLYEFLLLLAKKSSAAVDTGPGGKGLSLSWALVIFGLLIGLALTLTPAKRTYEVKKEKED